MFGVYIYVRTTIPTSDNQKFTFTTLMLCEQNEIITSSFYNIFWFDCLYVLTQLIRGIWHNIRTHTQALKPTEYSFGSG